MVNSLRRHALAIFESALAAADPGAAIERIMRTSAASVVIDNKRYRPGRVWVVGAGKASATMAAAVEGILGNWLGGGCINTKYGHLAKLRKIELNECGHPVPDANGEAGARRIAEIVREAKPEDLVLCLVSGGASALMPAPAQGITLAEKQETTKLLLACGANIHEMNTVRKHLSYLKGGQLARLAGDAQVVSLILSDVVGDDLDVIGSGPTAPDSSTFADAVAILNNYGIWNRVPEPVRERLSKGERGGIAETPKKSRALNLIIGSNTIAVEAAKLQAKEFGYRTMVLSTTIEGETRDVAGVHAAIAREIRASSQPARPPVCLISGGETTVTIRGDGKGGRAQEFALAAALGIEGLRQTVILCGGTDGTDGPTDAAGALCDGTTVSRARKEGFDARKQLANNDAYPFFAALGDLIVTGPTGTNVADVRVVLVGR